MSDKDSERTVRVRIAVAADEDGLIAGVQCPRAASDMTPCCVTDGTCAFSDDGACVGCGWRPTLEEWREHREKAKRAAVVEGEVRE